MPEPIRTLGGNLVVFEGETRGEWTRDSGGWHFDGIWPTPRQRQLLERELLDGRGLLVVMPVTDASIVVLRSEIATTEHDLAEVPIEALDWMSASVRARGLRFRAEALRTSADVPILLRPPVTVSSEHHRIRFAVRTGRCSDHGPAFGDLADHLFGPEAKASTKRLRWPYLVRRAA